MAFLCLVVAMLCPVVALLCLVVALLCPVVALLFPVAALLCDFLAECKMVTLSLGAYQHEVALNFSVEND